MRSYRQRQRKNADRAGIAFMALALALVLAGGALFLTQRSGATALDEAGCPLDGEVPKLAILLDRSDALSARQKSAVQRRIGRAVADTTTGTRVSLHVLDPGDPELVRELFAGCRPEDGSEANRWTQNERRLRERWERDFLVPLERTLERTLIDNPTRTSPILEAIQSVALGALSGGAASRDPDRLLIVSDMIQHVPEYSHYRDSLEYARFRTLPYAARVHAQLDDVLVDIAYVGRPAHDRVQTNAHGLFWERHIVGQGGELASIRRLPGG